MFIMMKAEFVSICNRYALIVRYDTLTGGVSAYLPNDKSLAGWIARYYHDDGTYTRPRTLRVAKRIRCLGTLDSCYGEYYKDVSDETFMKELDNLHSQYKKIIKILRKNMIEEL